MPHNDENWLNGKINHIKRTEQEILNDFEKLGYLIMCNSDRELIFETPMIDCKAVDCQRIHIFKQGKTFYKYQTYGYRQYGLHITMQEHKLLTNLFRCWRWI